MIDVIVTIALWLIVVALGFLVVRRSKPLFRESGKSGVSEFLHLLPRIAIGVLGSGFIAAALPPDFVGQWLGSSSGIIGIVLAIVAGAATPGGPVVGFAISAAALKGGAGAPQVIAYSTAWALYAFPRLLSYELPIMPARVVWLRVLASLPLPFIAAAAAMLLSKP
ncbi:hypothetical protein [Pseudorhodoplanes sinuspersici]|uniref:Uncharacterized protein n=1 Tax=Pseudorhodoplanes sinuspersici TaxID=1235591 RepID=A0A1W6ZR80_9HYPH|nr:hypothetical protein [Pseudorhodoplanes sinuspersici]ARP99871.1 hypothetical protein CAK95_12850 [Pseudorhodoplanes sinuspersici]RKE70885.1 hypothetical protein DFP91_3136 [Pseudorhodoplanes sinuspersici]